VLKNKLQLRNSATLKSECTYCFLIAPVHLLQCMIHSMSSFVRNRLVQQRPMLIIDIHVHLSNAFLNRLMLAVFQSRQLVHYKPGTQSQITAQQWLEVILMLLSMLNASVICSSLTHYIILTSYKLHKMH